MRFVLAIFAAIALAAPAAMPAQGRSQGQHDWSRTITQTPEGGFRMGNPNAPVKLVEYLSLTCPHCAEFAEQGMPRLVTDYVQTGRVSLEYRNYVLNGFDLAATFLSRCAAPDRYFALNHDILASRSQWVGRAQALTAEQRQQLQGLPLIQTLQRVVGLTGLDAIAARHGIVAARAQACLSDQAGLDRIEAMRRAADSAGVNGTPTFAINGRIAAGVHDWAALEPLLRTAQ